MSRPLSPRLLPLAAAALIGWSGAALAQARSAPNATSDAPPGEQTLQNNAATRALDRAAGTNVSGAYPGQADGTPANPPGTAATRALDRAAGTNTSGAYPGQERQAQNNLGQGAPQGSARSGSNAQGGAANNSGATPPTGSGNTASRPESQRNQPASPSTSTTEAPSLEMRQVPPSTRPDQTPPSR